MQLAVTWFQVDRGLGSENDSSEEVNFINIVRNMRATPCLAVITFAALPV